MYLLPRSLEDVYVQCLRRKHRGNFICDPDIIAVACAAPQPLSILAARELAAMEYETTSIDRDAMPAKAWLVRSLVGLVTLDDTELLLLPAHNTVRDFIFSRKADSCLGKLPGKGKLTKEVRTDPDLQLDCVGFVTRDIATSAPEKRAARKLHESYIQRRRIYCRSLLGQLCLTHIKSRASRALDAPLKPVQIPNIPVQLSALRRPLQWVLPYASSQSTIQARLPRLKSKQATHEQDGFLTFAIANWIACNEGSMLSENPPFTVSMLDRPRSHDLVSTPWRSVFENVALDRNESYAVHPWPAIMQSRTSHLLGMFAYAVANNHSELLSVVIKYRTSLPRGSLDSPLASHDLLPALHVAAKAGFTSVLGMLMGICDQDSRCQPFRRTALHYAAEGGHVPCFETLLSPSPLLAVAEDANGQTVLHLAASNGHTDVLDVIHDVVPKIAAGLAVAKDGSARSPTSIAAQKLHRRFVARLAELDTRCRDECAELLLSAASHGQEEIAQLLLDVPDINTNLQDAEGHTTLWHAVERGSQELSSTLLERYMTARRYDGENTFVHLHLDAIRSMSIISDDIRELEHIVSTGEQTTLLEEAQLVHRTLSKVADSQYGLGLLTNLLLLIVHRLLLVLVQFGPPHVRTALKKMYTWLEAIAELRLDAGNIGPSIESPSFLAGMRYIVGLSQSELVEPFGLLTLYLRWVDDCRAALVGKLPLRPPTGRQRAESKHSGPPPVVSRQVKINWALRE